MEQNIKLDQEAVIIQQGEGAVSSVNGKTGVVVLKTSDIENDSGYQTQIQTIEAINDAIDAFDETVDSKIATEATAREQADTRLDTAISGLTDALATETTARVTADTNLQSQIDGITASSDVTDIVGTYAELQSYDTSTLGNNDIIKVLQDESRNNETTYYRWSTTTQSFTLIGEEGPYYTKSQADGRFVAQTTYATDKAALEADIATKQDELTAGNNVQISGNVISATDTTYSDFTGTDGQTTGVAGLVPAPATTDAGKFLKADGTWDTAGGGSSVNVVQTTGTSTTDVMSQKAASQMVFPSGYEAAKTRIAIGANTTVQDRGVSIGESAGKNGDSSVGSVLIGHNTKAYDSQDAIAIGDSARASGMRSISIGASAQNTFGYRGSVALGAGAITTRTGEVNVGTTNTVDGYNSTNYRVIGGVHPAVDNHDAVNLEQMNARIIAGGTAAPTTSTVGEVGTLYAYVESGTGHLAICTDDTGGTYTWQTLV